MYKANRARFDSYIWAERQIETSQATGENIRMQVEVEHRKELPTPSIETLNWEQM